MGYHTEFEGKFDCFHADSKELRVFLQAVYDGDDAAMGMLGDWLMDRGDPRGTAIASIMAHGPRYMLGFWMLFGLKPEHAAYLKAFSETRRMRRDARKAKLFPDPVREAVGLPLGKEGGYFVGGRGFHGQAHDESVIDGNKPPRGQPGLWCKWAADEQGTAIVWTGAEKFYDYVKWLEYLIGHFLAPWGYVLNGEVKWWGEDAEDWGTIVVIDNDVEALREVGTHDHPAFADDD